MNLGRVGRSEKSGAPKFRGVGVTGVLRSGQVILRLRRLPTSYHPHESR